MFLSAHTALGSLMKVCVSVGGYHPNNTMRGEVTIRIPSLLLMPHHRVASFFSAQLSIVETTEWSDTSLSLSALDWACQGPEHTDSLTCGLRGCWTLALPLRLPPPNPWSESLAAGAGGSQDSKERCIFLFCFLCLKKHEDSIILHHF